VTYTYWCFVCVRAGHEFVSPIIIRTVCVCVCVCSDKKCRNGIAHDYVRLQPSLYGVMGCLVSLVWLSR